MPGVAAEQRRRPRKQILPLLGSQGIRRGHLAQGSSLAVAARAVTSTPAWAIFTVSPTMPDFRAAARKSDAKGISLAPSLHIQQRAVKHQCLVPFHDDMPQQTTFLGLPRPGRPSRRSRRA